MIVHFIEASNDFNHGKFLLLRMGHEDLCTRSALPGYEDRRLIAGRKFGADETLVVDLQTGEGAAFTLSGGAENASYDLDEKHRIWCCPLYEPFLCGGCTNSQAWRAARATSPYCRGSCTCPPLTRRSPATGAKGGAMPDRSVQRATQSESKGIPCDNCNQPLHRGHGPFARCDRTRGETQYKPMWTAGTCFECGGSTDDQGASWQSQIAEWEDCFGDYSEGRWAWLFTAVTPIDPVLCRGAQRLWRLRGDAADQVSAAYLAAR